MRARRNKRNWVRAILVESIAAAGLVWLAVWTTGAGASSHAANSATPAIVNVSKSGVSRSQGGPLGGPAQRSSYVAARLDRAARVLMAAVRRHLKTLDQAVVSARRRR